jgi:hypothetical protein
LDRHAAFSWERIPYAKWLVKEKSAFQGKEGDEFRVPWMMTGCRGERGQDIPRWREKRRRGTRREPYHAVCGLVLNLLSQVEACL